MISFFFHLPAPQCTETLPSVCGFTFAYPSSLLFRWWAKVANATSLTSCWNFSLRATKSVSQLTCIKQTRAETTGVIECHHVQPTGKGSSEIMMLVINPSVTGPTSTMTAALSLMNRPIRPSLALRPSSLFALFQPSFWACSCSQVSAWKWNDIDNTVTQLAVTKAIDILLFHFLLYEHRWGLRVYLCHVIIKLLQGFLAVNESVASAFPQLHQEGFVSCQKVTTCV